MDHTSLDLARKARQGSKNALEALIERSLPGLHAFVKRRAGGMIRERESVSDLVQSACREVLEDLPGHEFSDDVHFQNWLHQAALRKIIDRARFWRAERRDFARGTVLPDESSGHRRDQTPALSTHQDSPSEILMRQEDMQRIERALAKLPKSHRDVIVMHRFLGLSHADIAGKSGRTEEATRALLHRATRSLSRLLKGTPPA